MIDKSQEELLEMAKQLVHMATDLIVENFPAYREATMEVIEAVFVPKAMARQLVLAVALETGALTLNQLMVVFRVLMSNFSTRSRLIRQLHQEQRVAETQDEWMDLAEKIDNIQGNDIWRTDDNCPLYERERISSRIDEFVHLMRRRDIFDLMFTLRGCISRNKFGLLHEGLFSKAMAGSKVLVETYHNVVCAALDFVCDAPVLPGEEPIPNEARLAFFNETRHAYGRTALILSGGAALGFYHLGVVKALVNNGLLPRVIGGSSAGSIVCAMLGTRTDHELLNDMYNVKGTVAHGHSGEMRIDFFRPVPRKGQPQINNDLGEVLSNEAGAFADWKRTWQLFVPIGIRQFSSFVYDVLTGSRRPHDLAKNDTEHLKACVRANCGNFTFQEAFDRTGRILNITVSPQNRSDPPRLLNYLTAPHVLVWSAAVASSALPGVFEPTKLLVKDADGTERYESSSALHFQDGSMENDLPMEQLSEMFNINHFIVSQANPHAVMFASFGLNKSVWSNPFIGSLTGVLLFVKSQVKAWLRGVVELIGGRRIAPLWDTRRGFWSQFFTQEYEGRDLDISLIPWQTHRNVFSALLHCIYNPSEAEFLSWIKAAERETWRYIPAIKSHCAEEMTLDRCVQRVRKRIMVESQMRNGEEKKEERMGGRVPSFFTSQSLVNLGGLNVADPANVVMSHYEEPIMDTGVQRATSATQDTNTGTLDLKTGWGGMGLRGNHSLVSLGSSCASGLFMFDDADNEDDRRDGEQRAGEHTSTLVPRYTDSVRSGEGADYMKTTSMANFYYRHSKSQEDLQYKSDENLSSTRHRSNKTDEVLQEVEDHQRRKSKSTTALQKSSST